MVRNSSLMICLSCQMLGQDVPEPDEPITNQALLMGLAGTFLQPLAPLLLSPYVTEACLVPFLESLCHLSSVCGHFEIKTPSGKKRRLVLFLDMMWAFLEVRCFIYCLCSSRQRCKIQWRTQELCLAGCSTNSVEDRGQRERGSGGGRPLVRGSGGSCNLVQEISFHIVKFS